MTSLQSLAELSDFIHQDPLLRRIFRIVGEAQAKEASPDPGHDLSHFLRVALWTTRLGDQQSPPVDRREAIAAALMHDIVAVPKNSPLRKEASRLCAEEAERILRELEVDEATIARISEAIRCHSFSRGEAPKIPLAKVLQDADRLEAVGSIGIFRLISTGVRMGAGYFHAEDPWAKSRDLNDTAFSTDHFFTKLLKLPDTMTTEAGKTEAQKRAKIMKEFLISLGHELGHPLSLY